MSIQKKYSKVKLGNAEFVVAAKISRTWVRRRNRVATSPLHRTSVSTSPCWILNIPLQTDSSCLAVGIDFYRFYIWINYLTYHFRKKIQYSKISIMYIFMSIWFHLFFSLANFSWPSLDQFAPNLSRMCLACDFNRWARFLISSKTTSRRSRNIYKLVKFSPIRPMPSHFRSMWRNGTSLIKKNFFAITSRLL